jgi:transcriptional regulator with XRE-family HTH domain
MINRLKVIMEKEGLNPSQLADKLNIQRSGLSHILSGRNNPSLDFVKKVLTKFPQYGMEWFIFGDTNVNSEVYKSKQGGELSLFNDSINSDVVYQSKPTKLKTVNPLSSFGAGTDDKKITASEKTSVKQLVKIIMVYDNHTFEELRAE